MAAAQYPIEIRQLARPLAENVPGWCWTLRFGINAASQVTDVPPYLIAAVIYQESGGNPDVEATVNTNGYLDEGLMQVNQLTQNELQHIYPGRFNGLVGSARNIMFGASYLRHMYDTAGQGNWAAALRAYNSGPNNVNMENLHAIGGAGDPNYVDRVFHWWDLISNGQGPNN